MTDPSPTPQQGDTRLSIVMQPQYGISPVSMVLRAVRLQEAQRAWAIAMTNDNRDAEILMRPFPWRPA